MRRYKPWYVPYYYRAAIKLSQWQIFENENPDTFLGMYQFWIQKPVCNKPQFCESVDER